jgi:hypothetical protein
VVLRYLRGLTLCEVIFEKSDESEESSTIESSDVTFDLGHQVQLHRESMKFVVS